MTPDPRQQPRSPWPGPVPYLEDRADVFFGRKPEITALLRLMGDQNLSVLSAPSGVGKSSLIRAGLVPALRRKRREGDDVGPVLVLSNWGNLSVADSASVIALAIRTEIESVRRDLPTADSEVEHDFETLLAEELPALDVESSPAVGAWIRLKNYVKALCDATDGLVLILDQAEELLGSGLGPRSRDREKEVLGIVGRLSRDEPRLNILVSLREEYYLRLQYLDTYVKAVAKRTSHLDAMGGQTAREAILSAASGQADPAIDKEAVDEVLLWFEASGPSILDNETDPECRQAALGRSALDLLGLQAFLFELTEWAKAPHAKSPRPVLRIGADLVNEFRREVEEDWDTSEKPPIAQMALRRYIDRLFDKSRIDKVLGASKNYSPDIMRRILVRMAPLLSGGGFKRHIEEAELVYSALSSDLRRLRVSEHAMDMRSQVAAYRENASFEFDVPFDGGAADLLSGVSRSQLKAGKLSLSQAAALLVESGFALTQYLKDQSTSILKGGGYAGGTCELVHDGIGTALTAWAESERGKLSDVCSSVVSSAGEDFQWAGTSIEGRVEDMCWLSCRLHKVTLSNVEFTNCNLTGTLFSECTFSNCRFTNCVLTGSVFLACEIEPTGVDGQPGLTLTDRCLASSIVFKDVKLGSIRFNECDMSFGQLKRFTIRSGAQLRVVNCDLRNALFEDVEQRWVTLEPTQHLESRAGLIKELKNFGRALGIESTEGLP